jgi:hypothetical protein
VLGGAHARSPDNLRTGEIEAVELFDLQNVHEPTAKREVRRRDTMWKIVSKWLKKECAAPATTPLQEDKPVSESSTPLDEEHVRNVSHVLEQFIELGSKHYFELHNGHRYQGYPSAVEGAKLLMWDSGPCAADEQLEVAITDINLKTLSYWDDARRAWIDAHWDEHEKRWTHLDDEQR